MLDLLVSGKTRLKVLTKFFLAPEIHGHLRGLSEEFGESTNAIRLELNRFEQGGLLVSGMEQNRKVFRANRNHPLFSDITSILRKHMGVDSLVEQLITRLGNVTSAYLLGEFALGRDADHIDLVLVGEEINLEYLDRLTAKAEKLIRREIKCTILSPYEEKQQIKGRRDVWKVWGK
ncbi:MAG: ArsR family transcriptional regulator [Bacteroidetes bacterium]|nr:ArsR family transcriptional regulator [Bacteroidota bacterium]